MVVQSGFLTDLVGNPEGRFCRDAVQVITSVSEREQSTMFEQKDDTVSVISLRKRMILD